jgi:hypothetical protein
MKNLFIGASITLLLISCNIEKRIYMPGYHIISNTDNRNLDKKLAESKVGFRKGQFLMMKKEERLIKTIDTLFVLSDKSMSTLSDANQIIILPKEKINFLSKPISKSRIEKKTKENIFNSDSKLDPAIRYKRLAILFAILAVLTSWTIIGFIVFGILTIIFGVKARRANQGKKTSGFAVSSLWLSLLALLFSSIGVFGFFLAGDLSALLILSMGFWLAVFGIVFGFIALRKIRKKPEEYKGEVLAKIGLKISLLVILGLLLLSIFYSLNPLGIII